MSEDNDLIQVDELEPINATPRRPLKADTGRTQGMHDGPGLTDDDVTVESSVGLDEEIPEPPDERDIDDFGMPSPGEVGRRIEKMSRMQVFDYVLHVGAVVFDDGHELISCPGCNHDAVCGLRPTEHEITGNTVMVCTGPTMEAKHRLLFSTKFEAGKVKRNCPHHPDKRRELPKGTKELREIAGELTSQEIDDLLREEYSR